MEKAAILAIFASMAGLLIKKSHPEISVAITIAAGALLLLAAVPPLTGVVGAMRTLGGEFLPDGILSLAVKLTGISLLAQFGAQVCKDADNEGLAQKVEFFGKVTVMVMIAPVLAQIMSVIIGWANP